MSAGTQIDGAAFRRVLGRFATGVTVITARDDAGQHRAITVNSFTSVSLDPPLILYCLGTSAFRFAVFARAKTFAINILRADQEDLSDRFARESDDDFADLATIEMATGSPMLADCLAALDCELEAVHDAGDHGIVVGRVAALHQAAADPGPLVYYGSAYRRLGP